MRLECREAGGGGGLRKLFQGKIGAERASRASRRAGWGVLMKTESSHVAGIARLRLLSRAIFSPMSAPSKDEEERQAGTLAPTALAAAQSLAGELRGKSNSETWTAESRYATR